MTSDLVQHVSSRWWTFLVRAVAAAAVAVFAFSAPAAMTIVLGYVVAAYFLISGITAAAAGIGLAGVGNWWLMLLMGVAEAAFGISMLVAPGIGPFALASIFAAWLILTGMMQLAAALALRDVIRGEFWLGMLGVVTATLGFFVLVRPDIGVAALVYTIGWYAAFAAVVLTAFAFRLRSAGAEQFRGRAPA